MDAKFRWHSDRLDGAMSFKEPLGQTKVMQIRQGKTLIHQVCCLAAQSFFNSTDVKRWPGHNLPNQSKILKIKIKRA